MQGLRYMFVPRVAESVLKLLDARIVQKHRLGGVVELDDGLERRDALVFNLTYAERMVQQSRSSESELRRADLDDLHSWLQSKCTREALLSRSDVVVVDTSGMQKKRGHARSDSGDPDQPASAHFRVSSSIDDTLLNLRRREARCLGLAQGKWIAAKMPRVDAFVDKILQQNRAEASSGSLATTKAMRDRDEYSVATYHGVILALCASDGLLARELAAHPLLPALNGSVVNACARLAPVAPGFDEMRRLVQQFVKKDEQAPSCYTVATAVCRAVLQAETASSATAESKHLCAAFVDQVVRDYRVDPSSVYAVDAAGVQRWASRAAASARTLEDRTRIVLESLAMRYAIPKVTVADALSIFCMNDVERCWIADAFSSTRGTLTAAAAAATVESADVGVAADDAPDRAALYGAGVLRQGLVRLALQDPKRWLLDSRLLHEYAELLRRGLIEVRHPSFPSFLDEVGDCHRPGEHPSTIEFEMTVLPDELGDGKPLHSTETVSPTSLETEQLSTVPFDSDPIALTKHRRVWQKILERLAPSSAYWCTLVRQRFDWIRIEPAHEPRRWRVTVTTHTAHECMQRRTDSASSSEVPEEENLPPILWEDEDLLVVDKPSDVATSRHALASTQRGGRPCSDLLSTLLCHSFYGPVFRNPALFRGGQVHRLDKETTGVLVYAKTPRAMSSLRHQFGTMAQLECTPKTYFAMCIILGHQSVESLPLSGSVHDPTFLHVVTRYRILKMFPQWRIALVECRVHQGKKHQVRRHLASVSMPILQDVEYGGPACCSPLFRRIALHASSLSFVHPRTQRPMCVVSPLPADFRSALQRLLKSTD